MNQDLISRQAAIEALRRAEALTRAFGYHNVIETIRDLPSVQPEHLVKESGNLVNGLVNDCISRQAAINALGDKPLAWTEGLYELGLQNQWQSDVDALKELPSVQPEIIRCRDCKNWKPQVEVENRGLGTCSFHNAKYVTSEGYCYWAERRQDGTRD